MQFLLGLLLLLAGVSPLLTFTRLWQVKEWRWDRMREHLRHEGWMSQIFGWVRPCIVGLGLLLYGLTISSLLDLPFPRPSHVLWATVGLLAWFTLLRMVVGKQRAPVWTRKAVVVLILEVIVFGGLSFFLVQRSDHLIAAIAMMLLPLLMFPVTALALLLCTPIDRFLKARLLVRARRIRERCPHAVVVGITGSVGKTTTKELLAHILSDRKILATPAHVNTELGVAHLMLRILREDHQVFIVEMGAYRRGEIALLCSLVQPHIGVITFIGDQHLGLFGSREDLCRAKGELFASLPPQGHAFLNADTEYYEDLAKMASCPVHTVGTGGHATFEAFDIQERANGISFTLRGVPFSVPILGTHQVTNILLAVATAEVLGIPLSESAKRLTTFRGLPQTFERKEGQSGQVLLDDTHNASPASFAAAIEWAEAFAARRKLLVTSGILELGKEEGAIHEELGSLCRGVFGEVVFLSKKCVRNFEQGYGKPVRVVQGKKLRIQLAKDMLIVCEGRMPVSLVQRLLS